MVFLVCQHFLSPSVVESGEFHLSFWLPQKLLVLRHLLAKDLVDVLHSTFVRMNWELPCRKGHLVDQALDLCYMVGCRFYRTRPEFRHRLCRQVSNMGFLASSRGLHLILQLLLNILRNRRDLDQCRVRIPRDCSRLRYFPRFLRC